MNFLLVVHSTLLWLVLLVAVIAAVRFAIGWLRGGEFTGLERGLAAGFSGLMDLQASLGLILLIWTGLAGAGFPMVRIEHATTMILAVVVGHLPARWKKAGDQIRFRNTLFCMLGALLLVYVGVTRLPGGWSR